MQGDAIAVDTTGATHARQQPRYVEREKKRKAIECLRKYVSKKLLAFR